MKSQFAFTLVEVIITLSIMMILLAVSIPSIRFFVDRIHDDILLQQLFNTLQLAHQESRVRNSRMVLCKSNNHVSCSGQWIEGQLIFEDENEDGIVHSKKQIVAVIQSITHQGVLYWRSFPYYRDQIVFLPSGLTQSDNGAFWYCHAMNQLPVWALMLNKSGKVRVVYPNKQGVIIDGHGKQLNCTASI